MKWSEWLEKWSMHSLKINTGFLEMEWAPKDADKNAAWELYIELLTRITTQKLPDEHGVEQAALSSIFSLFALTRDTIKRHGRHCFEFTKIAIIVLNQVIRPFTAKWHRIFTENKRPSQGDKLQFRTELKELQRQLQVYTQMLSDMAGVEDLTSFEDT